MAPLHRHHLLPQQVLGIRGAIVRES
uniref:Uncharacterized protein n=1 Tax=Arundo donax TaxID=35708 RepID=A0A0A8ZD24_ARUDO